MTTTIEDLDRRVSALEAAAETEKNIIRAVSEIVSEAEHRTKVDITQLRIEMKVETQRLDDRIGGVEKRFTDLLNDRFDKLMEKLDGLHNPPK
jgi:hypothetical protein